MAGDFAEHVAEQVAAEPFVEAIRSTEPFVDAVAGVAFNIHSQFAKIAAVLEAEGVVDHPPPRGGIPARPEPQLQRRDASALARFQASQERFSRLEIFAGKGGEQANGPGAEEEMSRFRANLFTCTDQTQRPVVSFMIAGVEVQDLFGIAPVVLVDLDAQFRWQFEEAKGLFRNAALSP